MNISTVNSTTPDAFSNITTSAFYQPGMLDVCLFSFNLMFGLPTHSYVIWLIVRGTESEIASDFFNLNLSVCEIFFCLNSLFNILITRFQWFIIITRFFVGLPFTGRPLFQCLICVERYLAVVHPVIFLKYKPLRYRVICSTAAWIIILSFCLFWMLTINNMFYFMWSFSFQFLLFLSIQLFCLLAVLRALKQSGPGERGREREENHIKRRAFNIILINTVSMGVTYVPYSITGLFTLLTKHDIQVLWSISLTCFMLAGFLQPVLYLHRTRKFSCLCGA